MNDKAIIAKINQSKTKRYYKAELQHYALGILFFFITLLLFGCSTKEQVVYKQNTKEVFIPVRCQVEIPAKPAPTGDTVKDNINITAYSKEVEQALKACIKGE